MSSTSCPEDAGIAMTPGVKKKALADVANSINQKAAKSYTLKKGGIQFPLEKGQFTVFQKSDKILWIFYSRAARFIKSVLAINLIGRLKRIVM